MHSTTLFERLRRSLPIVSLACILTLAQTAAASGNEAVPVTSPLDDGGSALVTAAPEPAPPRTKSRRTRVIYACTTQPVVEFSDRPCATGSAARSLDFTTGAGAAPSTKPRVALASTRPKATPAATGAPEATDDDHNAQERKCESLGAQLDKVDARMRQGYAAREAADLWNRWRDLKQELHSAHCRGG
jgi:hypothetical protein